MSLEIDLMEELKSADTYPTGPCSALPRSRNRRLAIQASGLSPDDPNVKMATYSEDGELESITSAGLKVKATPGQMAAGLMKTARQAVTNGKVSSEIRNKRYDTCKACPAFKPDSKRCSECGCFMEAKTWVGGDPDMLCPLKKWEK